MNENLMVSARNFTGMEVHNLAGDDLGKIDNIMINLEDGCVAYAVLSFGGWLGMGDKLFAVPWQALGIERDRGYVILDVDKERLKSAPGFDKDNWPDMASTQWVSSINEFYGVRPRESDTSMRIRTTDTAARRARSSRNERKGRM